MTGRTFAARRSARYAAVFLVVFSLMAAGGVVAYISGERTAGIALMGFSAFALVIIMVGVASPNSRYVVTDSSMLLRKGFASRTVSLTDIGQAQVLSADEAESALRTYLAPVVQSELNLNLRGWASASRRYGEVIRYCSVPVVQSRTTAGSRRNITHFGAKITGDFVLVELRTGGHLLISPTEPAQFVEELQRRFPALRSGWRAASTGQIPPVPSSATPDSTGRQRYRRLVMISSLPVLIIAGYLVWSNVSGAPGQTPHDENSVAVRGTGSDGGQDAGAPTLAAGQTGWIDDDTFRATYQSSTAMVALLDDADQRRANLREAVDYQWPDTLTSELMGHFLARTDDELSAETYEQVRERFHQEVLAARPVLLGVEYLDDVHAVEATMELHAPDLRPRLTAVFSEYADLTGGQTSR